MRFGVGFLRDADTARQKTSAGFDRLLQMACRADELGFEFVALADRPGSDPVPLLSAAAALTVGIRVVASAALPATAQAPALAARLATLDNLAHGRLDVCFELTDPGRRWPVNASAPTGAGRLAGIEACRRVWSGPPDQRPHQQPHPPVFVAGAGAVAGAMAGHAGCHLQTADRPDLPETLIAFQAGRAAAGLEPGNLRLEYFCYLAADDRLALAAARRHRADPEHHLLAGSPARVRDRIADVAQAFGDKVSLQLNIAAVPDTAPEQALELFAEQVMPYFAGQAADLDLGS